MSLTDSSASEYFHRRTACRIAASKRKARSELEKCGWRTSGYAYDHSIAKTETFIDNIERVDASKMTLEEFIEKHEKPGIPVILTGLTTNWQANNKWTVQRLFRKYRNQKFKCGEDDEGYSVKLKMKYYVDYMSNNEDDSPLYIFDSSYGERAKTMKLLDDYDVPVMFQDDLFRYASEKRRPPYRWFVMGPERSGTSIHVDPLGTSAWNALIVGNKRWCLIHPKAPKNLVKPTKNESDRHPDEAITWFKTVFPRVISSDWCSQYPTIHALQRPGDVMFVPSGWWHVVMNVNTTIAVTQNFCSVSNLSKVWPKTLKGRRKLASHWLRALRINRPDLIPKINNINMQMNCSSQFNDLYSSDSSSSSSSNGSSDSDSDSVTELKKTKPVDIDNNMLRNQFVPEKTCLSNSLTSFHKILSKEGVRNISPTLPSLHGNNSRKRKSLVCNEQCSNNSSCGHKLRKSPFL